ncbi:MAG: hypothetical protein WBQ64_15295, partial [Terriglobales bacterium]
SLDCLRELEGRGVETLDCRSAQFSADEPVSRLRMISQSWKVMFHAEYSSGSPLRMLVDLRNVVDAALSRTTKKAVKLPPQPAPIRAKAAVAAAQFAPSTSDVPEFDVTAAPEWDQDPSAAEPGDDDKS